LKEHNTGVVYSGETVQELFKNMSDSVSQAEKIEEEKARLRLRFFRGKVDHRETPDVKATEVKTKPPTPK
jgi:hypothetical protein